MLSIVVDTLLTVLRLFGMWPPIARTMTIKAEFIGGPTVLRCFISVFKYLHKNFAILLEMTELEVDNSESASKCLLRGRLAEESPRAAFGRLKKGNFVS